MTAAWRKSVALIALLIAACASTPQASPERDAEAKEFRPDPRSASVHIFRPTLNTGSDSVLYVDQKLIGSTLAGGFFVVRLRPGVHTLSGIANDQGRLQLEVRAGELYFVRLTVRGGQSLFEPVSVETGKREVLRCCVLFESWEPGQRPLLR
jgi:hypothetical protein